MSSYRGIARFSTSHRCPNCQGGGNLPQGQGVRCWGISFEDFFLCTREELSEGCKETDTGYLHSYVNCHCGKPHDGTELRQNLEPAPKPNRNKDYALGIWNDSVGPEGTSTHDYLRNRGIDILSDEIRHHPALAHTPSGLWCEAMIVRVSDSKNQFLGIERHYIDGGAKAFETQNKMSLGNTVGGSVKLGKLDGSGVLGVAEGVITALTLNQELAVPTWACLGASNLHNIQLPPLSLINTVKIFTDGDQDGEKARNKAGDKWLRQGYKVISCQAPEGIDYNDVLERGIV